jgi:hypothetical protein
MAKSLTKAERGEYATKITLISIFLSIFAAFVSRMPLSRQKHEPFEVKPFDMVLLGFATLRLGRLVAYDLITEPVRKPFAKTVPDETGAGETVMPRTGSGFRQAIGELVSCPICSGTWIAAGLVYALHMFPNPTRIFTTIMGVTGLAEFLNALTEALAWSAELARKLAGINNRLGR